ncbi:MAG: family 20 glycosylhydrolase, partial [Kiritimatiellae bacterium]|nr:family 20 glycosylhydrolase [Kiritimatiellia bacterium]
MKTMLLALTMLAGVNAWCTKPEVIPELKQWTDATGVYALDSTTRVLIATDACVEMKAYAATFAAELGVPCVTDAQSSDGKGAIILRHTATPPTDKTDAERYWIEASPDQIVITGKTALAAFWGTRTVLQVFNAQNDTFPCGVAEDWPDYSVRGFMFDCGRKPFTLTTLRQIVDICAYYKMNEVQLHLSDNYIWLHRYPGVKTPEDVLKLEPSAGAFRLESKIPGLTATDMSYSKQDYRNLEAYALNRGVKLIPELDVPGHALAMVRVRPDLMYKGSVGKKHECERAAMLDLTNPETFPYVASIFDEYIDSGVFSGDIVHIGTDEYYGDNESYRAFADKMLKHIKSKGKTPRLWGSFTYKVGKTPVISDGVQMHIWSLGWQKPKEAIQAGYDIVNILDVYTYVVPNGKWSVGGYGDDLDTKFLWETWTPAFFGKESIDPNEKKLLGGAWAMWNDNSFLTDPGLCGRDLLPRIRRNTAVFAQKTWKREKPEASYGEFLKRLEKTGSPVCVRLPQWERSYVVTRTGDAPLKLAEGDETDLWAVSPVNGNVGFRREGAQYTFNYTLPKDREVALT